MDIIERLLGGDGQGWAIGHETRREAATEITRLREENKRMREALEGIMADPDSKLSLVAWREAAATLATLGGE